MKWVDILKETITQGRVKEIEDIDIDIEDDDCLRWLEKLFNIIAKDPDAEYYDRQIDDEESACKVKAAWGRVDNLFISYGDDFGNMGKRAFHHDFSERTRVSLAIEKAGMRYTIELTTAVSSPVFKQNDTVMEVRGNEAKAIKIVKELCNYLNIPYDKFTEGLF